MPSPAWPGLELEDVHAVQPLHVPLGDPPDEGDEVEDPISTRGASKRRRVKEDEELMLRSFLSQYGLLGGSRGSPRECSRTFPRPCSPLQKNIGEELGSNIYFKCL